MSSISDPFTDLQGPSTTLPGGSWTPGGSRTVSAFASVGGSGFTTTLASTGFSSTLRYTYTPTADFTNIDTILLNIFSITGTISVSLTMEDNIGNSATGTVFVVNTPQTLFWLGSEFAGINLSIISFIQFDFLNEQPTSATLIANILSSTLVCLGHGTKVLMADGTEKEIQDIDRGDIVRGDVEGKVLHKVARKLDLPVDGDNYINIAIIEVDALGKGVPHTPTIISGNHPVVYQNARRPVRFLKGSKGIAYHEKKDKITLAKEVVPKSPKDSKYYLYDLQFDHDGTYIANGLTVQSRSPYSDITPLPKDLYFEPEKYWKGENVKNWDSLDHEIPLSFEPLIIQ